jgi:hypothetical protein
LQGGWRARKTHDDACFVAQIHTAAATGDVEQGFAIGDVGRQSELVVLKVGDGRPRIAFPVVDVQGVAGADGA